MTASLNAAAIVRPCIVRSTADSTGKEGLLFRDSLAGSPAMATLTLPAAAKGAFVDLLPVGCNVQYGFVLDGSTKPTLVYNTTAAMGAGAAAAGKTLINGVEKPVFVPQNAKELVYIWEAATAGAFFEGCISSARASVG